jgi:hypothetical protein
VYTGTRNEYTSIIEWMKNQYFSIDREWWRFCLIAVILRQEGHAKHPIYRADVLLSKHLHHLALPQNEDFVLKPVLGDKVGYS